MLASRLLRLARAPPSSSAAVRLFRCPRAPIVRFQSTQSGGDGDGDDKFKRSFRGQLYNSTVKRIQTERVEQARGRAGREDGGTPGSTVDSSGIISRVFCESVFRSNPQVYQLIEGFGSDGALIYLQRLHLWLAVSTTWDQCLYQHLRQHRPSHCRPSSLRNTTSPNPISKPRGPNSAGYSAPIMFQRLPTTSSDTRPPRGPPTMTPGISRS